MCVVHGKAERSIRGIAHSVTENQEHRLAGQSERTWVVLVARQEHTHRLQTADAHLPG